MILINICLFVLKFAQGEVQKGSLTVTRTLSSQKLLVVEDAREVGLFSVVVEAEELTFLRN